MTPEFPQVIDNTILQAWARCKRYAYLTYFCHYKRVEENTHLIAGAAFAAGMEAYRKELYFNSGDSKLSLVKGFIAICQTYGDHVPMVPTKTMQNVILALLHYHNNFPKELEKFIPVSLFGQEGVEFSFAVPLNFKNPQTGEPVIFCGRADQIVYGSQFEQYFIEDDKTTSQLGTTWGKQWELDSQMTGYVWAARKYKVDIKGALIRGFCFYNNRIEHTQVLTHRQKHELEDWENMVYSRLEEMRVAWVKKYYTPALNKNCGDFGGCVLQQYCKYDHKPEILKADYKRIKWDPVNRKNVFLDD
jgi:hypothetical protein